MSLLLIELKLAANAREALDALDALANNTSSVLVESQVTADHAQAFVIFSTEDATALESAVRSAGFDVSDVAPVRLVGADLDEIIALKPAGNYLVEWDLPAELTMDKYLARKKEKAPLYDQVPEVKFLRTYVREDMIKCLCFYDGESEEDIKRAREVVSAPIDRLYKLGDS
jgi:hypothetical protein